MTIVTRAAKGSELTHEEMDNNFSELDTRPNGQTYPKTKGIGIKLDTTAPVFGWEDLPGNIEVDYDNPNRALMQPYVNGISERQFISPTSVATTKFHLPHDYAPGTDLFIHIHWSHNSTLVTGGSVTWNFEVTYAKGHNQGAFSDTILVPVTQLTSTIQRQHRIAETALSVSGGSGNQLDSSTLETDGVILCALHLDSNDLTVSGGAVPDPFVHYVDLHYQSTGLGTKNKTPDFWS